MPLNRPLFDEDGNLYDIIAGSFFITGLSEDGFTSVSPELIEKYTSYFRDICLF